MALVSTIKTVVQVVTNLDKARKIYEKGLGLTCVGETETSFTQIGEIWGVSKGNFRVARFARVGEEFGCVDLVENKEAFEPIRSTKRAFDYGIVTFNYRTNNLDKAVAKLKQFGAVTVSETMYYNVGKPMYEVMLNTISGERLTILQLGEATVDEPFFNEAIATVGMVVPSMQTAQAFYTQGLGLEVAISFQSQGKPFNQLLGIESDEMKLDFATLTAKGNWTGKVELLELGVPNETPINTNELCDFSQTGYTFVTFLTDNLDEVKENCQKIGAKIVVNPIKVDRPFHKNKRAMIVRSHGGEYLEIIEN